jgi:hypothetical protein
MALGGARTILLLGSHGTPLSGLAERVRQLGFRTLRARALEDALALAAERDLHFGAVLLDPRIDLSGFAEKVHHLEIRAAGDELVCIAAGEAPDERHRKALRTAGVHLALWSPIGQHALRFQLNRALSEANGSLLRSGDRVPTGWLARIFASGREKPAHVYSLSPGGAYLETHRPSLAGAEVAVELPLPTGPLTLGARVIYTNVPGNLRRHSLPHGMAVQFTAPPPDADDAIRASLEHAGASLLV